MGKKRQHRGRANKYLNEEDRKNDLMMEYYKGIFNWDNEKWNVFYSTMRAELPATFRVTGFRQQSQEVQWLIRNKFLEQLITKNSIDINAPVESVPLAKPLPWYPNEMAWQLNASKMEIRKTPELKKLHNFLISETDCGFISRQEAVSMLPPLLLDIESHHKVLDLCAAPGSKTAQLVEMLHAGTDSIPTGVVIANDIDSKRCYMMVHQLQRLQSPCIVVVRQDASIFPRMFLPDSQSKSGKSPMLFDRILADVPCSGDGTLRKNQDLWPRWSPFLGVNEHFLQMKILRRSLEMLVEGGKMVYSTCSLNPVEDEAVLAAVLSQSQGTVRLVDISDRLSGLISECGLTRWKVMLKDCTWCSSIDEVPIAMRRSFRPSLFPPADVDTLNLQYCRRILPQNQNTGGFFIALLEKVSGLPWMKPIKSGEKESQQSPVETITSTETESIDTKIEPEERDSPNEEPQTESIDTKIEPEERDSPNEEPQTESIDTKIEPEERDSPNEEPQTESIETKIEPEERDSPNEEPQTESIETKIEPEERDSPNEEPQTESIETKIEPEEGDSLNEEPQKERGDKPIVKMETNETQVIQSQAVVGGDKLEPPKKKARIFKEDPFYYISPGDKAWDGLKAFYEISEEFPNQQLMYRNADGKRRNYYFTNELLKQLVEANSDRDINFVNLGVKLFGISEDRCFNGYRILQEGVEIIERFIGASRRLVLPTRSDLLTLLMYDMPLIGEFSQSMQQAFQELSIGPVMFQYDLPNSAGNAEEMPRIPLRFAGWRGRSSLRHYVGVHERSHLLRLCGTEPVDVVMAARKDNGDKNYCFGESLESDIEDSRE